MMAESTALNAAQHPYYPLGVEMPNYLANTMSPTSLVIGLTAGIGLIFFVAYLLAIRSRPTIKFKELLLMFWWTLCGSLHVFFEGYFVFFHAKMPSRNDFLGQLWKEYALSDSRYIIRDPTIVCMEAVTVLIWGPVSFFIAYAVVVESPWRHPVQLIVSTAHLYGDVLYYAICWYNEFVNGVLYSRPERFYYWMYFVFCNAFWIFIPLGLITSSARAMAESLRTVAGAGTQSKKDR